MAEELSTNTSIPTKHVSALGRATPGDHERPRRSLGTTQSSSNKSLERGGPHHPQAAPGRCGGVRALAPADAMISTSASARGNSGKLCHAYLEPSLECGGTTYLPSIGAPQRNDFAPEETSFLDFRLSGLPDHTGRCRCTSRLRGESTPAGPFSVLPPVRPWPEEFALLHARPLQNPRAGMSLREKDHLEDILNVTIRKRKGLQGIP
jgi:hypothetical protein